MTDAMIGIVLEQCRNCKRVRLNCDTTKKLTPPCDWCLGIGTFLPVGTVNLPDIEPETEKKTERTSEDNGDAPVKKDGE